MPCVKSIPTSCEGLASSTDTPPNSPHLDGIHSRESVSPNASDIAKAVQIMKEIFLAVKLESSTSSTVQPSSEGTKDAHAGDTEVRIPNPDFKVVEEVWNASESKYKIIEQTVQPQNNSSSETYLFVIRVKIDKLTGDPTHYVDVKSADLRDALRIVLGGVSGVSLNEDKLSIERAIIFHFLTELETLLASPPANAPPLGSLQVLVEYIQSSFADAIKGLENLLPAGEITYDLLWTLFKPGSVAYTICFGTQAPRGFKVSFSEERETKMGVRYYRVEGTCLDFDGTTFGESRLAVALEKFRGAQRIHQLAAFPLAFHPNRDSIREGLLRCGRKFVTLMSVQHCDFTGSAFYMEKGEPIPFHVNGRVTIDAAFFRQSNPGYERPSIDRAKQENSTWDDFWTFLDINDNPDQVKNTEVCSTDLKDEDLLICSPTALGFSYSDKMWLEFAVGGIRDITWNGSSIQSLVLPDGSKEAMLALAESRAGQGRLLANDVIEGKNRGLNILLHGPPGVGKTLTAEVLSEHLQMPLYYVSAGEFGTDPKRLEDRLTVMSRLAQRWRAILLLDEADVFLEQRTTENIARNALVSVFLRKLEYMPSILILTTNRVENFDLAILSRIHWKMRYNLIDASSRLTLWQNSIERAQARGIEAFITPDELVELARKPLNGRQINNSISTACALAKKKKDRLSLAHLQVVLAAQQTFEQEFHNTHRADGLYT